MEASTQFQILLRRRIPIISSVLFWMLFLLFAIVFILYLLMTPTNNSSTEMSVAYYILVIPDFFKRISSWAILGLIVVIPLYYAARLNKPASFTYDNDTIFIKGEEIDIAIPQKRISKIYFNDLHNLLRQPKGKIQIVIKQKNKKLTSFLLANYDDGEIFMDTLGKIENIKLAFYDDNLVTDHENE